MHINKRKEERLAQIEKRTKYKELFHAYNTGMAIVAGVLVGGVLGYFLDKWLDTLPVFLIIFLICGFIAGIKNAMLSLKQAGMNVDFGTKKKDETTEDKEGS